MPTVKTVKKKPKTTFKLVTRVDFAKQCGISPGNLANYIGSGHVILTEGMVDVTHKQNLYFLEKRKRMKEIPHKVREKPKLGMLDVDKKKRQEDRFDLNEKKLKSDIEKNEIERKLKEQKFRQMSGEVIPYSRVKAAFEMHFTSLSKNFKSGIEGFLSEIGKKTKLNRNEIAELRGSMLKILNRSIEDAVEESKRGIKTIVEDYA